MRTIVKLSKDDRLVTNLLQIDSMLPLNQLFEASTAGLLFEVTALEPPPQPGWRAQDVTRDESGKIIAATFIPPPGPTVDELKARLRAAKTAYLLQHYDLDDRGYLQMLFTDDQTPPEVKALIRTAGEWTRTVKNYWSTLEATIVPGMTYEDLHVNFEQFDNSDPKVKI